MTLSGWEDNRRSGIALRMCYSCSLTFIEHLLSWRTLRFLHFLYLCFYIRCTQWRSVQLRNIKYWIVLTDWLIEINYWPALRYLAVHLFPDDGWFRLSGGSAVEIDVRVFLDQLVFRTFGYLRFLCNSIKDFLWLEEARTHKSAKTHAGTFWVVTWTLDLLTTIKWTSL